jgi:hypothetical protein
MVDVSIDAVDAFGAAHAVKRQRGEASALTLEAPLMASSTTITVRGGSLVEGARLGIDDEWCEVGTLMTSTQATLNRGMEGTQARSHDAGAEIDMLLPLDSRSAKRRAPVISATTKQGACPMCGCTGDHPK